MPKSIHVDVRRDRDEREETLGVARSRDKNRETVDIIRPSGRREYETRYYDEDTEDYYARKKALIKRQQSWPHKRGKCIWLAFVKSDGSNSSRRIRVQGTKGAHR